MDPRLSDAACVTITTPAEVAVKETVADTYMTIIMFQIHELLKIIEDKSVKKRKRKMIYSILVICFLFFKCTNWNKHYENDYVHQPSLRRMNIKVELKNGTSVNFNLNLSLSASDMSSQGLLD